MSAAGTPNNFPNLGKSIQQWGLAHWTYILTFIIGNLLGVFLHF